MFVVKMHKISTVLFSVVCMLLSSWLVLVQADTAVSEPLSPPHLVGSSTQSLNSTSLTAPQPLTNTRAFTHTVLFDEPFCRSSDLNQVTTAELNLAAGHLQIPELNNSADQREPALAAREDGSFYVVWVDYKSGNTEIRAQLFDRDGYPLWVEETLVSDEALGGVRSVPDAAVNGNGNLVVAWSDTRVSAGVYNIYMQKIDEKGVRQWVKDKLVRGSANSLSNPKLAAVSGANDVILIWSESKGLDKNLFLQRIDDQGNLWNSDFQVNRNNSPLISYAVATHNSDVFITWSSLYRGQGGASVFSIHFEKIKTTPSLGFFAWGTTKTVTSIDQRIGLISKPIITVDELGNSYTGWEQFTFGSITTELFLRKFDSDGNSVEEWGDGQKVYAPPGSNQRLHSVSVDEADNVFMAFTDQGSGVSTYNQIWLSKWEGVTAQRLWQRQLNDQEPATNSRRYPEVNVVDGRAIVVWEEWENNASDIMFQAIDESETRQWAEDQQAAKDTGTPIGDPQIVINANNTVRVLFPQDRLDSNEPSLYSIPLDVFGNVTAASGWQVNQVAPFQFDEGWHLSSAVMGMPSTGLTHLVWESDNQEIWYQQVNSAGEVMPSAFLVGQDLEDPEIAVDPVGITYMVAQSFQRDPDGVDADIVLQKMVDGQLFFSEPVQVHVDEVITHTQLHPAIAYDEVNDSLFTAWYDDRDIPSGVYLQNNSTTDGSPNWDDDKLASTRTGNVSSLQIVATDGYAYLFWLRSNMLYGQKVDRNGNLLWGAEGRSFDQAASFSIGARAYNGQTYLYLAWADDDQIDPDIYLQRLDTADGSFLWSEAVRANSDLVGSIQESPALAIDTNGYVFVVWKDYRRKTANLYAQRIDRSGAKMWPVDMRLDPDLYQPLAHIFSCNINETSEDISWATLEVDQFLPDGTAIEYSLSNNGGSNWELIIPNVPHQFSGMGSDLRWRAVLVSNSDQTQTPIIGKLTVAYTTGSVPPRSVYVRDEQGNPVAAAEVYRNGRFEGVTNDNGLITLQVLDAGDILLALSQKHEELSHREIHSRDGGRNYAYHVYLTSAPIGSDGQVNGYVVDDPVQLHALVVRPENPLILFNLVVSIEWGASTAYLTEISRAMRRASDYLYDFTDGQMAFGYVAVYSNKEHWEQADIQIMAKNNVQPHAYIGGVLSEEQHHVIRLGRQWDGLSGNHGSWDHPFGYRTIAHEFGHYGLFFYDEYFGYVFDNQGNPIGREPTTCTGVENKNPETDATNASVMDFHYASSELSHQLVQWLWSLSCEKTAQFQLNNGESTWETLLRIYADNSNTPEWVLTTPYERGGVLAGPHALPNQLLAAPFIVVEGGSNIPQRELTVVNPQGEPLPAVLVALYKGNGRQIISQGLSDSNGRLTIYGSEENDTLRAITINGDLAGNIQVTADTELILTLNAVGNNLVRSDGFPSSAIRAFGGSNPGEIDLSVALTGFDQTVLSEVIVTKPDSDIGLAPPLTPLSPEADSFLVQTTFEATEKGSGQVQITGFVEETIQTQIDYRLQLVRNEQTEDVFSSDGQLHLQVFQSSLPNPYSYFVVAPPITLLGNSPEGKYLVGNAYSITAGDIVTLEKDVVLTLSYEEMPSNEDVTPYCLELYQWEANNGTWVQIHSSLDVENHAVSASIQNLGTYALFASPTPYCHLLYLPILTTNEIVEVFE